MRVASVQFAVGTDVEENLATCVRMLEEAAAREPDLIVLPEFCNHLSWYADRAHAHRAAVDLDGHFVKSVATKAAEIGAWVQLNCTIARGERVTGTNLVFDRSGTLVASSDKRVLMGAERDFMDPGTDAPGPVIDTPFGRIGTYACMEGVICEITRCLALAGADVLCNSLNSFALDEAALHVPVRAAENGVFVVAANKVGPLLPAEVIDEVAARIGVPAAMLHGAGESQIVGPDGEVIARAPRTDEAVVVADIDPARALRRERLESRRPALYKPIASAPSPDAALGAERIEAAAVAPRARGSDAVEEACALVATLAREGVALVVLAGFTDVSVERAAAALTQAVTPSDTTIVCALADGPQRETLVIDATGVVARRAPLHTDPDRQSGVLADELAIVQRSWGRLAVMPSADLAIPESARLAAIARADVLAVPARFKAEWEWRLGVPERAAENRVNVVAAGEPSVIAALPSDATLWAPARTRPFDGRINTPEVTSARETVVRAPIYPARASERLVSRDTDLVDGRPWALVEAIAR